MSLITPESVWQLQEALRVKAKKEPACRFHSLFDKVYRKDVLFHAWRCGRSNGGAPGVDNVTFEEIEARGVADWLEELATNCERKLIGLMRCARSGSPNPELPNRGR